MSAILSAEKALARASDVHGDNIRVDVLETPSGKYVAVQSINFDGDCEGYSLEWAEVFDDKQTAFDAAVADADRQVKESWEKRRAERQVEIDGILQYWTPMQDGKGWTRRFADKRGDETIAFIYILPNGGWHAEYTAGGYGHRVIELEQYSAPDLLDYLHKVGKTLADEGYIPNLTAVAAAAGVGATGESDNESEAG